MVKVKKESRSPRFAIARRCRMIIDAAYTRDAARRLPEASRATRQAAAKHTVKSARREKCDIVMSLRRPRAQCCRACKMR